MTVVKRPLSVADSVVIITEVSDFTFYKLEGGKITQATFDYASGDKIIRKGRGPVTYENITISRPFKEGDESLLAKMQSSLFTDDGLTITHKAATKKNGVLIPGRTLATYFNCQIVSITLPNADDIGSDGAMTVIELTPYDIVAGPNSTYRRGTEELNAADNASAFATLGGGGNDGANGLVDVLSQDFSGDTASLGGAFDNFNFG